MLLNETGFSLQPYGIYSWHNQKLATQNHMHFNQLCAKSFNLIFNVSLEHRQRSNQRRNEGLDMLLNKTGYSSKLYSKQNWKLATQNCMHFNQLCAKSFNLIFKVSVEPRQRSNQRRDEGAADDCPVSSFSEPRTSPFFPSYSRTVVKSINLQYNMLVRWDAGTKDLATKRLMFPSIFFFAISCKILLIFFFNLFFYFFIIKIKSFEWLKNISTPSL